MCWCTQDESADSVSMSLHNNTILFYRSIASVNLQCYTSVCVHTLLSCFNSVSVGMGDGSGSILSLALGVDTCMINE